MSFELEAGVNVFEWASLPIFFEQPRLISRPAGRRWLTIPPYMTHDEAVRMVALGFDHVRFFVHEAFLYDERDQSQAEGVEELHAMAEMTLGAGLRLVVVPATLRAHRNMDSKTPPLYCSDEAVRQFAGFWRRLAAELRRYPPDMLACEPLNEPVAPSAAGWNAAATAAIRAIREVDPSRPVVVGSNAFSVYTTVDELDVPLDSSCILSFHYYLPMLLTHHRIPWWPEGMSTSAAAYPPPAGDGASGLATMRQHFAVAADAARRRGLPLNCGEFGCCRHVPVEARLAWHRDAFAALGEHGISWTLFDYRGEHFGLYNERGKQTPLVDLVAATRQMRN